MEHRVMVRHRPESTGHTGICACGHVLQPEEVAMGYRVCEGEFWYVCLTCHFWYVHFEAETLS